MQVNGWELFAHPLLQDQLDKLITAVEKERAKKPTTYRGSANFKVLAALRQLLFITIPADPTRPEYRQGGTLGGDRKHWFRAKFGGQRFRLFFRYDSKAKIIIYAWVNDSDTLRTYGSKNDADAVFGKMLDRAVPSTSWPGLEQGVHRFRDFPIQRRYRRSAVRKPHLRSDRLRQYARTNWWRDLREHQRWFELDPPDHRGRPTERTRRLTNDRQNDRYLWRLVPVPLGGQLWARSVAV
jgi:toxin YhaV